MRIFEHEIKIFNYFYWGDIKLDIDNSIGALGLKENDVVDLIQLKNVSIHVLPENEKFVMTTESSAKIFDLKSKFFR